VGEVIDLAPADIEPPPSFGAVACTEHLAGVAKVGKKIVLLLDLDRILCQEVLLAEAALAPEPAALPEPSGA
jgi:purine-binding chemotaxis protein CheW